MAQRKAGRQDSSRPARRPAGKPAAPRTPRKTARKAESAPAPEVPSPAAAPPPDTLNAAPPPEASAPPPALPKKPRKPRPRRQPAPETVPEQPRPEPPDALVAAGAGARRSAWLARIDWSLSAGWALALLAGLAAGWQWHGLRGIVVSTMDPHGSTQTMLASIALLAAALGPWFPQRILRSVESLLARRAGRPKASDGSLPWVALALLGTSTGVIALLTLAESQLFTDAYRAVLASFFWTDLALACLDWTAATLFTGATWLLTGITVAMIAPAMHAHRPASTTNMGTWLMLGIGCSLCAGQRLMDWGISCEQILLLGVIPAFALAGIAAWRAQQGSTATKPVAESVASARSAEWITWLVLVVWGVAAVLLCMGWLRYSEVEQLGIPAGVCRVGLFSIACAAGMGLASLRGRTVPGSASECGMALWAGGVAAALAATVAAMAPGFAPQALVHFGLLALPLGYALHAAERAWSSRAPHDGAGLPQLTTAVLCGLGIGFIVGPWWALPAMGAMGAMATGSLLMMGCGGVAQIHERNVPDHLRHRRLAMVFASLSLVIIIFPWDVRQWAQRERRYMGPVVPAVVSITDALSPHGRIAATVCAITSTRGVQLTPTPDRLRTLRFPSGSAARLDESVLSVRADAFHTLRREHRRYDVFYQRAPVGAERRSPQFSLEWFRLLASRTAPGGRVILDIPADGITVPALRIIAATFEEGLHAPAVWTLAEHDSSTSVRLVAQPASRELPEMRDAHQWAGTDVFLEGTLDLRLHSLRTDRLAGALRAAPLAPPALSELLQKSRR